MSNTRNMIGDPMTDWSNKIDMTYLDNTVLIRKTKNYFTIYTIPAGVLENQDMLGGVNLTPPS